MWYLDPKYFNTRAFLSSERERGRKWKVCKKNEYHTSSNNSIYIAEVNLAYRFILMHLRMLFYCLRCADRAVRICFKCKGFSMQMNELRTAGVLWSMHDRYSSNSKSRGSDLNIVLIIWVMMLICALTFTTCDLWHHKNQTPLCQSDSADKCFDCHDTKINTILWFVNILFCVVHSFMYFCVYTTVILPRILQIDCIAISYNISHILQNQR